MAELSVPEQFAQYDLSNICFSQSRPVIACPRPQHARLVLVSLLTRGVSLQS